MLMMLCVSAAVRLLAKRRAQLMLMMLGVGGASGKTGGPADAHDDAGRGSGFWKKKRPG